MTKTEGTKYLKTVFVQYLDGFEAAGRICNVSGKAVQKWVKAGRLPRTEATGETNYSQLLANADPRIDAGKLLSTVVRKRVTQ